MNQELEEPTQEEMDAAAPCAHEWEYRDDSFDHAFGVERIPPYEVCLLCDETRSCESKETEYAMEKADREYDRIQGD